MITLRSHSQKMAHWWIFIIVVTIFMLRAYTENKDKGKRQKTREELASIQSQEVSSFKIHPNKTFTNDYHDAIEFIQEKQILTTFFQAINDNQPYQPQHDRTAAQWGIQISTKTKTIRIGCYIPDLKPKVVAGRIFSESGTFFFQSPLLLDWYQKYGHYWEIGDYQKEQHIRVISTLKSIHPQNMNSFILLSEVFESPEQKKTYELSHDTELVAEFVQTFNDIQFAAPKYKNVLAEWTIQIHAGTTTIKITCSIPTEEPTLVIGLIDSEAGYTYFQSQQLFKWYQKHSHRWLEPEEEHDTKEEEQERMRNEGMRLNREDGGECFDWCERAFHSRLSGADVCIGWGITRAGAAPGTSASGWGRRSWWRSSISVVCLLAFRRR